MIIKRFVIFSIILSYIIIFHTTNLHALPLRRSCGTDLTRRIADICQHLGGYNVLGSTTVASNTEHHHRVRRRVADECCKNVCSDTVISQYCYISSEKSPRTVEKPHGISQSLSLSSLSNRNDKNMNKYEEKLSSSSMLLSSSFDIPSIIHYQPLKIGTVAPEFTKTAITPQLLSRIHLFN